MSYKILNFQQISELVVKGIGPSKYKGAFSDANYLGSPGKDIFFWIESIPIPSSDCIESIPIPSSDEIDVVASLLAKQFPNIPPHNPIEYGACVRYIYGCFEKQGILRSDKDKKRMVESKQNWKKSVAFIERLFFHLEQNKCLFGLALLSEQMAHRFGDRYVIDNEPNNLVLMEEYYRKCYDYALQCKSKKHLMTTFYWEGRYWAEIGNKEKAIYYYRQAIKAANQYCPDARKSLQEKIMDEFKYLHKNDPDYAELRSYWKKYATNKAVKAVIRIAPK